MDGASSASPQRTSRTAATRCSGETSLSRKPLAPADSAAYTYWSRSNVVSMMIRISAGPVREDPPGRLQAVHLRHPDVHQHDVRPVLERGRDRLPAVRRLGHHRDARRAQDQPEPAADQRLVVRDDHPGARLVAALTAASPGIGPSGTGQPRSPACPPADPPAGSSPAPASRRRARPASSSPPYRPIRSRSPISPRPPAQSPSPAPPLPPLPAPPRRARNPAARRRSP